jgi:hypothetical protein
MIRKVTLPKFKTESKAPTSSFGSVLNNIGRWETGESVGDVAPVVVEKDPKTKKNNSKVKSNGSTTIEVEFNDSINLFILDGKIREALRRNTEVLTLYDTTTSTIIDSYSLIAPCRSFNIVGERNKREEDTNKEHRMNLINNFLDMAKAFVDLTIKRKENNTDLGLCSECNIALVRRDDGLVWCLSCLMLGGESEGTESTSSRNILDRIAYFKQEVVLPFQGKEDWVPDEVGLARIRCYASRHDISLHDMTMDTLTFILEHLNLNMDDHIFLVHHLITGAPCHNISHIEERIYQRHRDALVAYYTIKPEERRHMLKPWYLFYQYLTMEEYEVNVASLPLLKMRETLIWHNEMFRQICAHITSSDENSGFEWNPTDVAW